MKTEVAVDRLYLKSLTICLHKIVNDGYTDSFRIKERGILSIRTGILYQPADISVINSFLFESDETNQQTNMVTLYLIETRDGKKGTLIIGNKNISNKIWQQIIKKGA